VVAGLEENENIEITRKSVTSIGVLYNYSIFDLFTSFKSNSFLKDDFKFKYN